MIDSQGRKIDYIRISVTDRCNLRCVYCMPEDGIELAEHEEILSFDEIERLCRILAGLGFKKVKLTGGEPLVRKDLVELIRKIKAIDGIETVTMTSNGVLLKECMKELVIAGLDAVNISLDTVNPELFAQITRRDVYGKVKAGIEEALKYPQVLLKLNCVPLGAKEQDLVQVAALAKDNRLHVRFIEMMPIGYGKQYDFLCEEEIIRILEKAFGKMIPTEEKLGNGPCHYYSIDGFKGKIGFISAISHKFCGSCNRIRLTSQGYLKTCLQYENGSDLKSMLRVGCPDSEIRDAIIRSVNEKPVGHSFLTENIESEECLAMSQIGG